MKYNSLENLVNRFPNDNLFKFDKENELILNFELDADVTEFLASVEDQEYVTDWCKEILPDSDEF